jgi:hypothetical protein
MCKLWNNEHVLRFGHVVVCCSVLVAVLTAVEIFSSFVSCFLRVIVEYVDNISKFKSERSEYCLSLS